MQGQMPWPKHAVIHLIFYAMHFFKQEAVVATLSARFSEPSILKT
jgi:hypothetical protein